MSQEVPPFLIFFGFTGDANGRRAMRQSHILWKKSVLSAQNKTWEKIIDSSMLPTCFLIENRPDRTPKGCQPIAQVFKDSGFLLLGTVPKGWPLASIMVEDIFQLISLYTKIDPALLLSYTLTSYLQYNERLPRGRREDDDG